MLDLVDEAFDEMPLPVQVLVIFALLRSVNSRRDDRLDASGDQSFDEVRRVVALVADEHLHRVAFDERAGLRTLMALAAGQDEAQRVTQGINRQVYLRREAAAAAT